MFSCGLASRVLSAGDRGRGPIAGGGLLRFLHPPSRGGQRAGAEQRRRSWRSRRWLFRRHSPWRERRRLCEARELFELGLQKKYLEELGINEGEGFTVPPDDLVLQLAEACLAEAHEDCVADDNLTRLPTEYLSLWVLGELGLASDAALAQITTTARGLMEKCYRFDLEMTSIITVKEEGIGGFESVMTAKIPLRLKPVADLANAIVFSELEVSGSGVLYNESMTFEVAPGGCTITGVRGGGEFDVIKLPLMLGGDGLTEVNLTYHPGRQYRERYGQLSAGHDVDMPTAATGAPPTSRMHVDDISMTSDAGALSDAGHPVPSPAIGRFLGGEEVSPQGVRALAGSHLGRHDLHLDSLAAAVWAAAARESAIASATPGPCCRERPRRRRRRAPSCRGGERGRISGAMDPQTADHSR